ncbi:MAG: UDP-3-O-(3-hydroxymyristoyl)glucosamine N-acyltransferase [Candidatus Cyclobacteriaceae bacterium M3_2C_046]
MEFSINQVAQILKGEVEGDGNQKISKIEKIQEAKAGSITFLSNPKYENFIYKTNATAVIVSNNFIPKSPIKPTLIKVEDPYTSFTVLLEEYHKMINLQKVGIEDPSYVGKDTTIGQHIYRGAYSYIGNQVKIGDQVKIYPQVYIGDNVTIGDHTIIYAGAKIYNNTIIGKHCVIHAGAIIGSDGFGYAPQSDGTYKTIPQVGNVILKDQVDIGANTVIDRATFESTILEKGVKLDNLIQIAHNVVIGENTVIAAQSGISGSTRIGKNCTFGGQVGIAGHLTIADKVKLAAQTGVLANLEKEGDIRLGSPSMERMKFFKSFAIFRILPELKYQIKQLEEKILNLSASKGKDE